MVRLRQGFEFERFFCICIARHSSFQVRESFLDSAFVERLQESACKKADSIRSSKIERPFAFFYKKVPVPSWLSGTLQPLRAILQHRRAIYNFSVAV
jgi:hypothetical protein